MKAWSVAILFVCLLATSCENDQVTPEASQVEFLFSAAEHSTGGRTKAIASSVIISVESDDGVTVYSRKTIPLHMFGDDYLSQPIPLNRGGYRLTEFIVLDADGHSIYATPTEGSELAYLVDTPLPIHFSITGDRVTKVRPEVLSIESNTAKQFGYATFEFDVVRTITFPVGVMAYNPTRRNFELTSAHMQVTAGGNVIYDNDLSAATNHIRVNDGHGLYTLTVNKEGYSTYEKTFSRSALTGYATGSPLVIVLQPITLTQGLIAYYPFNGNADDQTANDLDGEVHGAVLTTDRMGSSSAAYLFDGVDDYIRVPHDEKLNPSSDYSISLWVNVASDQEPEGGINDILRKWNGNAEGYPFAIAYLNPLADDFQEDRILFATYDGQVCNNSSVTHSPTIDNDTFIHITLVREGDVIRTYLNGVQTAEVPDTTTCSTHNTADMTIGTRGNLVRFFKGKIDDIRIYGRALSDGEVASLSAE